MAPAKNAIAHAGTHKYKIPSKLFQLMGRVCWAVCAFIEFVSSSISHDFFRLSTSEISPPHFFSPPPISTQTFVAFSAVFCCIFQSQFYIYKMNRLFFSLPATGILGSGLLQTKKRSLFTSVLSLFFLVFSSLADPAFADTAALQNAITSKETEIRWKKEEIEKLQKEREMLTSYVGGYDSASSDLSSSIDDLDRLHQELYDINQANLVRLTIRMGIETYETVKDTVEIATAGVTKLATSGIKAGVKAATKEYVKDAIEDEAKERLGFSPPDGYRTEKLRGINAKARAAFPELEKVQRTLAMTLEEVQARVYHDEGIELGETGALLRKNLMVREAINAAKPTLAAVETDMETAYDDAVAKIPAANAELETLMGQLDVLETALNNLKNQLEDELRLEARAANDAKTQSFVPITPPSPSVPPVEGESESDYAARVAEALIQAVLAQWADQSPAILSKITAKQAAIRTLLEQISALHSTGLEARYFCFDWLKGNIISSETKASLSDTAASQYLIEQALAKSAGWITTTDSLISLYASLCDEYVALENAHTDLAELEELVVAQVPFGRRPTVPETAREIPGSGRNYTEADLGELRAQAADLPRAIAAANTALSALQDAWSVVSTATAAAHESLDAELAAAESALATLVSRGAQWQSALNAVPEATTTLFGHYGVWNGPISQPSNFQPVLNKTYLHSSYSLSMATLLAAGNASGARSLCDRFKTLDASATTIQKNYEDAWQKFHAAWRVLKEVGGAQGFDTLRDWAGAGVARPNTEGIPDPTSRNARFAKIYETVELYVYTDTNGTPVSNILPGGEYWVWWGLPALGALDACDADDTETLLVHRILGVLERLKAGKTAWMNLDPATFEAKIAAEQSILYTLNNSYNGMLVAENPQSGGLSSSFFTTHSAAIQKTQDEIWAVRSAYEAAHPAPTITGISENISVEIAPGGTHTAQLAVQASGDFMTYQWQRTQWPDYDYTWSDISGATLSTLSTTEGDSTWYYRCKVSAPGGTTTSSATRVSITAVYPPPVFLSADHTQTDMGQPFAWQFQASPPPHWWMAHEIEFLRPIPGLTFAPDTGRLTGTPTKPGRYVFHVMISNNGTMGSQEFTLDVIDTTPHPTGYDTWLAAKAGNTNATDILFSGPLNNPSGDGVCNLLKYAMDLDPTENSATELPKLEPDGNGNLRFTYTANPGATSLQFLIEKSTVLGGSWSTHTPAPQDIAITPLSATQERRTVTLPMPASGSTFYRLSVRIP